MDDKIIDFISIFFQNRRENYVLGIGKKGRARDGKNTECIKKTRRKPGDMKKRKNENEGSLLRARQ